VRARARVAAVIAAGAVVVLGSPVGAAPVNGHNGGIVDVDCGQDAFQVVVAGNGAWTPAHVVDSNDVFLPSAFGPFTGTFTPAGGGDPVPVDDPAFAKPAPRNDKPVLTCTYSLQWTSEDGTFAGTGSVTGFIADSH
jgi:hypothetical protein